MVICLTQVTARYILLVFSCADGLWETTIAIVFSANVTYAQMSKYARMITWAKECQNVKWNTNLGLCSLHMDTW